MKAFCLVLFLVLFFPPALHSAFITEARNAVAIDGKTGEVLFEHNAHDLMPPSSMSKLMTLYVAFSKLRDGSLREDDVVAVSTEAWQRGGSTMFLKEKQKVTVKDLISGIAIVSGNDASIAIAEAIKGTQESFAAEMNKYSNRLGLKNSYFLNSTGWPQEGHYMTAYDVAILARRLFYDFGEYYDVFSQPSLESNGIKQRNTNELVFKNNANIKVDGIKTGHSDVAGYGIAVSAYNLKGDRIFVVVNGLEDSKKRFSEAQRLINYVFDNFAFKMLYVKNQPVGHVKVYYGKQKKVPVVAGEDVFVVYDDAEENSNIKTLFRYNDEIRAPIRHGDKVGELIVTVDDKDDRIFNLYAANDVEELPFVKKIMYRIFAISNTKK